MKIWCVDYSCLSWHVSSKVFYSQEEAIEFANSLQDDDCHRKIYQVDDIWGWCARNFDKVVNEIIASRDDGDDHVYIYNMCNEIKEAAAHCGVEHYDVCGYWADEATFVLSVAWFHDGKLHHEVENLDGIDTLYNYPTIVERRSEWQK